MDDVIEDDGPPGINNEFPLIRTMALDDLTALFLELIPADLQPTEDFLRPLLDHETRAVCLACILVFLISRGTVVPRRFQLEAVLGSLAGDGIIAAGTGSGKTLIMIILLLLRPADLCILIVPLKRLQLAHLEAFNSYGINTVVINEDTSVEPALWQVSNIIFDSTKIAINYFKSSRIF